MSNLTISGSPVSASTSSYNLASLRSRLATQYALDTTDVQVKNVLNECIQTAYEKVVSVINAHTKERVVTLNTVVGQEDYSLAGYDIGIPTFIGCGSKKLEFYPPEVFREKVLEVTDNDQPLIYSLEGYSTAAAKTLKLSPKPDSIYDVTILCYQVPPLLILDTDYPLVPPEWAWLVLEKAKIERLRFEGRYEEYQSMAGEFAQYLKTMISHQQVATNTNVIFEVGGWQAGYNRARGARGR